MRTPLSAILGWAEMLQSGILSTDKRARASEAIFNNAKRQAQLIDELLDVARIMSGKLRLEHNAVDPREIVNGALETVQPAAEAKGIRIDVAIDPSIGAFHGDGPRLQQILWNLLSNAVKFTPAGGSVSVTVRLSAKAGEIVGRDSGPGISRDFLPSVFEPFRQAEGSNTRRHGGLGLGLSIVRELSKLLGGDVALESELGRGSRFTVTLPVVLSEQPRLLSEVIARPLDRSRPARQRPRRHVRRRRRGMGRAPGAAQRDPRRQGHRQEAVRVHGLGHRARLLHRQRRRQCDRELPYSIRQFSLRAAKRGVS